MSRTKWIVRTEDIDRYNIDELGIFSDLEAAIEFVRQEIQEEIERDNHGYEDWLYENDYDFHHHSMEEYVNEQLEEVNGLIEEMRESIGKGDISFEWLNDIYSFHQIPDYS